MKNNSGTVIVSQTAQRTNYLSHFTASSNAVTAEYILRWLRGGERENGIEYPFVITVEELERGLAHSKFGTARKLQVDGIALNVKIERFRLGQGVGSVSTYCSNCSNLQELSMWITVEGR